MKKNRVFLRGPTLSTLGRVVVPSKTWPCATCVTVKSAVTALSHPRRSPPPKEAASTLVDVPQDGARRKPDRVQAWSPLPHGSRSAAVVSRRLRKRGCPPTSRYIRYTTLFRSRVFLRGPTLSTLGRAVVPSKPWPCATCVTVKSAVTALSHPRR